MVDIRVLLDRDRDVTVRYVRPPPVTHSLTVNAFADGRAVAVDFDLFEAGVFVETKHTPFSAVLPEGTYTLRFPDSVEIESVIYDYDTHTVT